MSYMGKKLSKNLQNAGINNKKVLAAISQAPREAFIPESQMDYAYMDTALPIECGQTISQPYIVAIMTEVLLEVSPHKVLEVGTGSGYQAAVLAQLVDEIYTIERIESLYNQAKKRFHELRYDNINIYYGDGRLGYPAAAPYDGIIITAACEKVPPALFKQLCDGGRLIAPIGPRGFQQLMSYTRNGEEFEESFIENVAFVPLLSGEE